MARTGYTLPVFAVAAAKAALLHLQQEMNSERVVTLDLLPESAEISIQQLASLDATTALAITISDPGDNLDLLEIISAAVASVGEDLQTIQAILTAKTADAAYKHLVRLQLAESVFTLLAQKISQKASAYVQKYADVSLSIGTILCDRQGQIVSRDANGNELLLFYRNQ
jgi:cobalamin biosynthesis protein CbiD